MEGVLTTGAGSGAGSGVATASGPFSVGDIVSVQSRKWSGMNREGGVGNVVRVHGVGDSVLVDVHYTLGGSDKDVELKFVSAMDVTGPRPRRSRQRGHDRADAHVLSNDSDDGGDCEVSDCSHVH